MSTSTSTSAHKRPEGVWVGASDQEWWSNAQQGLWILDPRPRRVGSVYPQASSCSRSTQAGQLRSLSGPRSGSGS